MSSFATKVMNRSSIPDRNQKIATLSTFIMPDGKRVHAVVLDMDTTDVISTSSKYKQYDHGTSFIEAQLVESNVPMDLEGRDIRAIFRDSKGKIFFDEENTLVQSTANVILISDGVVRFKVPKQVIINKGTIECEILIFDSEGNRLTSPRFNFYVEESMYNHESITGQKTCGETLSGGLFVVKDTEEVIVESFLDDDFINRFGGE